MVVEGDVITLVCVKVVITTLENLHLELTLKFGVIDGGSFTVGVHEHQEESQQHDETVHLENGIKCSKIFGITIKEF